MKAATKPTFKPKPPRHRVNTYVDKELAQIFAAYCRQNRNAKNVSHMVEELMINTIKAHGQRYGLRVPARLIP